MIIKRKRLAQSALHHIQEKKKALNDIKKKWKTITYHIISHIMSCTSIHYDYNYIHYKYALMNRYVLSSRLKVDVHSMFLNESGRLFHVKGPK